MKVQSALIIALMVLGSMEAQASTQSTFAVGFAAPTTYDVNASGTKDVEPGAIVLDLKDDKFYGNNSTTASAPNWISLSGGTSATLSVTSKTANYTISSSDDVITADASGGNFTLTLPGASSNRGKVLFVKRTDSVLTNAVTVAAAGSDIIDGQSSRKLATQYETWQIVSDGGSPGHWHVIGHKTEFATSSYTPTYTGVGSVTTSNVWYSRSGKYLNIEGSFITGSVPATSTFSITLPSGLTIDSSVTDNTAQICGEISEQATATVSVPNVALLFFKLGTSTSTIYASNVANGSSGRNLTALNGDDLFASTTRYSLKCRLPISGWDE